MTVKFHFAPKPRRTVSCAWLGCSNRNYESFAPVLWVFEDYKCEAFVGYDVLYIASGSVPSCPCEKTWLQIRITFLKDKDKGTQSDLRRSHSRGQILLGRTYLRCLEPSALVLLDSCDAAHSCIFKELINRKSHFSVSTKRRKLLLNHWCLMEDLPLWSVNHLCILWLPLA